MTQHRIRLAGFWTAMVATAAVATFSVVPVQPSQAKLVAMVRADGMRNNSAITHDRNTRPPMTMTMTSSSAAFSRLTRTIPSASAFAVTAEPPMLTARPLSRA